ncbi:spore germination protein [Caldibacillus lycopersici]|uniref:Spore germination protein n=1 Tax=Perspicuibacillus lycopersici TaxID=1325689 RepID=A0AAE3LN79_9BACI|nr:spore germination protein [Perspicuibacillus lycopersici]MCU9614395.1 spore germination protein [Perspicuibacillus lycopersici]
MKNNLFYRTFKNFFRTKSNKDNSSKGKANEKDRLKPSIEDNLSYIKSALGNSADLSYRIIQIGPDNDINICVVFTEGLVDISSLQDLIDSLINKLNPNDLQPTGKEKNLVSALRQKAITVGNAEEVVDFDTLITNILSGHAALIVENHPYAITVSIPGHERRSVEEPQSATLIKGPRDGFTETLETNTALLRRRIRSANFWYESKEIGRVTKTKVMIAYIKGIVNEEVLQEVHKRLDAIDIDAILETGYIEELIQDETFSPFPTIFSTERPDAVAGKLIEGRVAILVDGSPFVMVVLSLMVEFFQASEDYYQRADIATLLRCLRFFCFFIALLAPSLYIAVLTYHQEMLPTQLLISLAAQREGVPFPAFLEALMMEVAFEILREAGVRMPRAVGQAMSIVGALVLGQAAVQAGIVSPAMVIVVSITAIANFCFPAINLATSVRIIRFAMMSLSAVFGLIGIMFGIILLCIHLCTLRSFGIPYTTPAAPFILQDQKDVFFRVPMWAMFSRPRLISQKNTIREQSSPTPKPTSQKGSSEV